MSLAKQITHVGLEDLLLIGADALSNSNWSRRAAQQTSGRNAESFTPLVICVAYDA
jgi:hypothetical protein